MDNVDGASLELVDKFCYLGDMLSADGGTDAAVERWNRFRRTGASAYQQGRLTSYEREIIWKLWVLLFFFFTGHVTYRLALQWAEMLWTTGNGES